MNKLRLITTLAFATSLMASVADETADLQKARELFPKFSKSVYTDADDARETYDALVNLSPRVQQRLLAWLDKEYAEKKTTYQREKGGNGARPTSNRDDAAEIKKLHEQLETIRTMDNEDEMKKVLKETGWPAMEKLLRLNKSNIKSLAKEAPHEPNQEKIEAALKEAKLVGEYRNELREQIGHKVTEIEEDLNSTDDANATISIDMSRQAAAVLKKNEKMKGDIPRDEYEGILELNHWRIAAGMGPLLIDPKLCDASRDHSKDMAEHKFFAHESPVKGKKLPWDRAKNFGTTANGENIAINDSTEGANKAWFYSPGHHKNMFNPQFTVMGLGAHGRHFTQLFR